jgi:O-antigen ligase
VHWLVTLGIVGVLAIGFLIFKIIFITIKMYRQGKGKPFISSYSLGTLASFVSILVAGLAEQNFWDQEITTLIYFTIGLNIALFRNFNTPGGK